MQVLSPFIPMGCLSPCPSRAEQRLGWLLPDVLLVLPPVREVQRARRGWQRAAPAGWPWGTHGALVLGKPLHRAAGHRVLGFVLAWQP